MKATLKRIIIIAAAILLALWVYNNLGLAEAQDAPAKTCPAGSYDIGISKDGDPICKLEPTGCPYGDSIPLGPECDKHAESQKEGSPVWDRWESTPQVQSAVDEPVIEIQGK